MSKVFKNRYGNDELTIKQENGGHVTIIKYSEENRIGAGMVGYVESFTSNNIGGTDNIKTAKDIDDNIEGIKRINRITEDEKALLIDFLLDIRQEFKTISTNKGLPRHNSLKQAQEILSMLDADTRLDKYAKSEDVYVGTFTNGREQGYSIRLSNDSLGFPDSDFKIAFAENRSSDDIVIYTGNPNMFRNDSDMLLDAVYFHFNSQQDAVDHIVKLVTDFMRY